MVDMKSILYEIEWWLLEIVDYLIYVTLPNFVYWFERNWERYPHVMGTTMAIVYFCFMLGFNPIKLTINFLIKIVGIIIGNIKVVIKPIKYVLSIIFWKRTKSYIEVEYRHERPTYKGTKKRNIEIENYMEL